MLSKKSSEASLRRNLSPTIPTTDMTTTKANLVLNLYFLLDLCHASLISMDPFAFQFLLAWEARRCRSSSALKEIDILYIDSNHAAHRRLCKRLECCTLYVLSVVYLDSYLTT
jgi:hypothetical protein